MKYCLFDGGDVVGPFTAKQLLLRPGFGSHSLVCPEEYSDEEAYWKEAHFYEEFGFPPEEDAPVNAPEAAAPAPSEQLLKEMDSVMTELSSVQVVEKNQNIPVSASTSSSETSGSAVSSSKPAESAGEAHAPEPAGQKTKLKRKSKETVLPAAQDISASEGAAAVSAQPAREELSAQAEGRISLDKQPAFQNKASGSDSADQPHMAPEHAASRNGETGTETPGPALAKQDFPANETKKPEQNISSILLQASEEMKRRRVGREAVSRAEEQQRSAQAHAAHSHAVSAHKEQVESALLKDPTPAVSEERSGAHQDRQSSESAPTAEQVQENAPQSVFSVSQTRVEARTVSQMSPIEEYFNTIKSGDLGNILGIPDPKENSDMNLVRALENQFEKTDPGLSQPLEEDPFDEFTPQDKAMAPQETAPSGSLMEQADKKTEENLKQSLPDLKTASPLPLAGEEKTETEMEEDTIPPAVQEMLVPLQEDDPNDKTVKTILEGKLKVDTLRQEIPEPIKEVPAKEKKEEPAAAEKEEPPHIIKSKPISRIKYVFLGLGVVILLAGAWLNWTQETKEKPTAAAEDVAAAEEKTASAGAEEAIAVPAAREAIHAIAPEPAQDPLELAKEIVQNYPLDKGRGTVQEYLNRLYSKQLQEGYAAVWSAEPLHRNSYVVKYRLAKTRKEPIVYIFQADTNKKKLTGALNNITLDLVGKIK